MNYAAIPLFSVMKAKLSYLSAEQSMLAQNVANADTPGYKAMDATMPDFQKMAGVGQNLRMVTTNKQHMALGGGANNAFKSEKRMNTAELNPNGNNVVIEDEMAKIAGNQAEYQKVLNLYSKTISMFKTALGNANTGS